MPKPAQHSHPIVMILILAVFIIGLSGVAGYQGQRIENERAASYSTGYNAGRIAGRNEGQSQFYAEMNNLGICRLAEMGCVTGGKKR